MKIAVSSCLLGDNCKYNGGNNYSEKVIKIRIVKENNADLVILQSRSPSCGVNTIYDGSFSGKLIPGQGVFSELLKKNGIKVIDVEDL